MSSGAQSSRRESHHEPVEILLDDIHDQMLITSGPVDTLMDQLVVNLESLRANLSEEHWEQRRRQIVSHRLVHLLHQDPFTRRCYYKPRGYAGDARMLDYIYGEAADDDSTALGRRILDANFDGPSPRAVRYRRNVLTAAIDAAAERIDRPRILAVACGHLREARTSRALQSKQIGELIAFDQDPLSLAVVEREFAHLGVRTEQGRVRDLIVGRRATDTRGFDLVYAAGLYDYLGEEPARRLTASLYDMLNPGGRLLVANFLVGIRDRGYMESFMDWQLTYRTMDEIAALASWLPDHQIEALYEDPDRVIGFVQVVRGAARHG